MTSYSGGDVFKVRAKYNWFDSPAKDYTVKIYSKQSLEVKDSTGQTNILHMDGQSPSGFTDSTYRGMNPGPIEEEPEEEVPVEDLEPATLDDLFTVAFADGFDLFAFFAVCFTYPDICFNPLNWF